MPWLSIPGLIDLDQTADFSRLRAPLGYWNALGLVCVLAGPIAVRTAADPEATPRLRSLAMAAFVLLAVTLGLTYSRGGILSLIVALDRARGDRARPPAARGLHRRRGGRRLPRLRRGDRARRPDDGRAEGGVAALGRRPDPARRPRGRDRVRGRGLPGASCAATPSSSTPSSPGRRSNARRAVAAGAAALLVLIGGLAVSERGVTGTLEREWDDFTTVRSDDQTDPARVLRSNSGNRWVWWREAAGAFSDEPLKGWGAGSFPLVHRRYRENDLPVRQAHSVPLQFLAETGLVGALLALGGLGLLGWAAAARLRHARGRERRYVAALACSALAWGIHMWFDWDSDIPAVTLPMLIFLGVLAARPPGAPDAVEAVPPPEDARAPRGPRAAGLLAGALILAALATSAYLPWLADDKTAEATLAERGGRPGHPRRGGEARRRGGAAQPARRSSP